MSGYQIGNVVLNEERREVRQCVMDIVQRVIGENPAIREDRLVAIAQCAVRAIKAGFAEFDGSAS